MIIRRLFSTPILTVLGLVTAFGFVSPSPSPAHAEVGTVVVDGSWACSVPAGYTYDYADRRPECGMQLGYRIRVPVDGLWACLTVGNFTHDYAYKTWTCHPSNPNQATMYHLRTPFDGLWACTVPPGFRYDTSYSTVSCYPPNYALMYHLRR